MQRLAGVCLASLVCVTSVRAEPPSAAPADEAAQDANPNAPTVDLNTASAAQLEELPGIGPARARAILEFRTGHGGFTQVSQLMRIKGIGRAMLRKLRPLVTISTLPASTVKPTQASPEANNRLP